MRNFWLMFVLGLLGVVAVGAVFHESRAADDREGTLRRIEDPSLSAMRNEVPVSAEMETALSKKQKEIEEREARVKEAEERLAAAEDRVKTRLDELSKLQDQLKADKDEAGQRKSAEFARLVKTFETMQPKKAAAVISPMEDPLAVELLMSMKEKKVAEILNVMDPNRAMLLSSLMAPKRPASAGTSGETAKASKQAARLPAGSEKKEPVRP